MSTSKGKANAGNGQETAASPATAASQSSGQSDRRLPLELLCAQASETYGDLNFSICSDGSASGESPKYLVCTQKNLRMCPPAGLVSAARIIVSDYGNYSMQVLLKTIENGSITTVDELIQLCSRICRSGGYKFCPGVNVSVYNEKYASVIRYESKSVKTMSEPFERVESPNCQRWHKLARNASIFEKYLDDVMCQPCKKMCSHLDQSVRVAVSVTPAKKTARQEPSSRCPLSSLSPASQKKRKINLMHERVQDKKRLRKYEYTEVTLDDDQSEEMAQIVDVINDTSSAVLSHIFQEADRHGKGQAVKEIWQDDIRSAKAQFDRDQARNETGKRSNRWSLVTIRMALAVFVRSPAAYEALKGFNLLQLPSRATLQSYTGAFLDEPGECQKRIADAAARYKSFQEERAQEQKLPPEGDGVLIFDEVRVISRLIWNSRSQRMVGLAMTHEDMSCLHDVYQTLDPEGLAKNTTYMLQFLWRDLTSPFDIVGPYYSSSTSFESKSIVGIVIETLKVFHLYGFQTSVLVCDGASCNLTAIKCTMSVSGMFGHDSSLVDPNAISPHFVNPFDPSKKIYWLICPSHQLKNMINALFSSRPDGTKLFQLEGNVFGWQAIIDLYSRECERRSRGAARTVPRLREIHVLRDSWTKLNVHPAKIMQEEVLTELYTYATQNPPPPDAPLVKCTLQYLTACSKLFEHGFLSHERVSVKDKTVLENINAGYSFYTDWLKSLRDKDPSLNLGDSKQRKFLSWQTWDLLRVDVYGFRLFCQDFLLRHPKHFISPLRVSGSAVESLFSQYKYAAGGKLDATNYATARAACLIRSAVSTGHHSGKGYRDASLNTQAHPLEKKKYNRQYKQEEK